MKKRKSAARRAVILTSTMLSVFGAGPAYAEMAAEEEPITVVGRRPAYGEAETSTATRTDTPLRDVPQSVTVITNDLIEDQAMRSMADVVRYVPGVTMGQGEGHRDAPTLRGNSSTADFFVDGVRDDVQYFRDLYNAERIEVLKGSNAMIFGRGGGGGVINRVTEWADFSPSHDLALTLGSHEQYRGTLDLGAALGDSAAFRLNGVYEQSDSYRDFVSVERWGLNPTTAFRLAESTTLRVGYEHFDDDRTVDRGVPSENGRPWDDSRSAFFGNPEASYAETEVDLINIHLDHDLSANLELRSRLVVGEYYKFYQNIFAGSAVNGAGNVTLSGYNSGTERENLFSQTDLIWRTEALGMRHTVLTGFELGHQVTDATRSQNFTGLGSVNVTNPTTTATGVIPAGLQTDSHVRANVAALYLQDQIALSDQWQVIAGVRFDRFDLDYDNRLSVNDFSRGDDLLSPRLGVIYRPIEPLSFYASYSVSYLPQSGDQFASLSGTTANLEPEEFENIELGLKWDVLPELALTAAIYQLDRTNTQHSPAPGVTVLTGAQRSEGFELGLAGQVSDSWQIAGGYAWQNVEITEATSVPAGRVVPLTPEHSFSLWNMVRFTPRFGIGIGITHQSEMFASINNSVTLPEFTRVDAALFVALTDQVEAQLNVENVFDEEYWSTAHSDNNITPGSPTAARVTLRARF
ncbi:MAG TPA: TonB-dependent siderophore receptor [Vitreimonas sp.]|uniref:TonB-dependent receptor n=1 Tax=Vitreimonas sp. TaxID=3069702 RepID=UPI002D39CDAA|nr:TonB-dependent siderophore receptor [Vitreimonas sp.]HYD87976.1 TonB-dependent siderophore receptor [Vitreimonas sp.]